MNYRPVRNFKTRVLVADDHDSVIAGYRMFLDPEPDIDVLEEAVTDGEVLVETVYRLKPDVVLLDVRMPHLVVVGAIHEIGAIPHPPSIVMVTAFPDPILISECVYAGASGFLLKEEAIHAELASTIRMIGRGGVYFSARTRELMNITPDQPPMGLTALQVEVLLRMAKGWDSMTIATDLGRSLTAIYQVQYRIRARMGVGTNPQLLLEAIRRGLIAA